VPGADLEGVIGFRDIQDVNAMLESAGRHRNAVVIGGGLLGLEAANGLLKQGMKVRVVHLLDTLMERQLDKPAAALLKAELEGRGLEFIMEAQTAAILGDDRVTGIKLTPAAPGGGPANERWASQFAPEELISDGARVPADLVVMAVGIRPNTALAQQAGTHCERGIVVDDGLRTSDPSIYAVGECAQHRGECYGLVAPLFEQAKVCARHLAGVEDAAYEGSVTSTKLKVTGIDLFSAGDFLGHEGTEEIVLRDPGAGVYRKLVIEDDRIIGAVLYGDTRDSAWFFELMLERTPIAYFRDQLMFGERPVGEAGRASADTGSGNSADSVADLEPSPLSDAETLSLIHI